jgi:hypothetical protein
LVGNGSRDGECVLPSTLQITRHGVYSVKSKSDSRADYATLYLTGIEAVLTEAAQKQLDDRDTRHPQIVNRAVSFNVIKNHALDLLLRDLDAETLTEKLTTLFVKNPTSQRIERNPPRKKSSPRVLLNFQKRKKKHCF